MKYISSFILSLSIAFSINAQGINFHKGDWESALKEAKKESKLIFVDAYTTWCGPCIWMSNNVFPDQQVGDFYNENFINVKLDMEKGEGILFAKAYDVIAYPTLFFIGSNGNMLHKGLGGRPAADFIALGEAALDPNKQIGNLEKKYLAGKREPELLKSYATSLRDAAMPNASAIAAEYLSSQEDWKSDENMQFIFEMADFQNMEDPLFKEVAKNKEAYRKLIGTERVDYGLKQAPSIMAANSPNISKLEVQAIFNQVFPNKYKQYTDEFFMNASYGTKEYVQAAVDYLKNYDIQNSNKLNEIAWAVYELTDDQKILKKAKAWTERSIKLNGNHMNYDTLAAICFKLNDKKEAIKHANTAIALAKENGEDASHTEELLKMMNK